MRRVVAGLLLTLSGCAPGAGPADAPRVVTPLMLEPPPVYALLGYRQDLGLASPQIAALDSIAGWVREANTPLIQQLRENDAVRSRNRGVGIAVEPSLQPVLDQVRANNRQAAEAVGRVLSEEQRETACRLFQRRERERGEQRERSGVRRRVGNRGARAMPADTTDAMGGRVWTWCPPAAAAEQPRNR